MVKFLGILLMASMSLSATSALASTDFDDNQFISDQDETNWDKIQLDGSSDESDLNVDDDSDSFYGATASPNSPNLVNTRMVDNDDDVDLETIENNFNE